MVESCICNQCSTDRLFTTMRTFKCLIALGMASICMSGFIFYKIHFTQNSNTTPPARTPKVAHKSKEEPGFLHHNINEQYKENIKFFELKINESDMLTMRKLLKKFTEVIPPSVTYFMMYGTLLGSYRHHGMIPWDTDIDLMVHVKHLSTLERVFEALYPEFQFVHIGGTQFIWRFFHEESHSTRYNWKWPFIDVFLYLEHAGHVWSMGKNVTKFEKRMIFPLKMRPFMDYRLLSPNNPLDVLAASYDLNTCTWRSNLATEKYIGPMFRSVPCEYLMGKFPFVTRTSNSTGTLETLVLNGSPVPDHQEFFSEHSAHQPMTFTAVK